MVNNNQPLISVQILNWNRAKESLQAIQSAQEQTYKNIEIVFVDNGSTDNSVELVKRTYPKVKVVELDKNYGCPEGRNKGISHCKGKFIFYLDNDGVLHQNAVTEAYETIKSDESIAIVAGVVYDFDKREEIDPKIEAKSHKVYRFANFQGGICLHRKSIYKKTGYYPSHFFYGGEEWHLTCRILDEGLKIIKNEAVILWHKRSDIARDRRKELMDTYYNKLYVSLNLYPLLYALLFLIYFPIQYLNYAKRDHILSIFCKSLFTRYPHVVLKALKKRRPIQIKTYRRIRKLNRKST